MYLILSIKFTLFLAIIIGKKIRFISLNAKWLQSAFKRYMAFQAIISIHIIIHRRVFVIIVYMDPNVIRLAVVAINS